MSNKPNEGRQSRRMREEESTRETDDISIIIMVNDARSLER